MNIGRNDPCHCGSGKKYKKCCLAKDEEQARKDALNSLAALETTPKADRDDKPKHPPDPRIQAWNARWDEFQTANYEDRFALFTRTLAEPELMDGEMAFEMLNDLFGQAAERNERDRFDALTESLRDRLPEVYEEEEKYIIEWRIINALAQGRHETIPSFTGDLARLPGMDIDRWNPVEDRLAYYGHLTTLVEAMRPAWPEVRKSSEIVPWGIDEFSYRAVKYEMLNYITQTASPEGSDPVLHERIEHYYGSDYYKDRIAHYIDIMIGQSAPQWSLGDFNLPPPEEESDDEDDDDWDDDSDWEEDDEEEDNWDDEEDEYDDNDDEREIESEEEADDGDDSSERPAKTPHPADDNLDDLMMQFVRYAHDQEGVSYTKAEMARHEMLSFIHRRHRGSLEYRESMWAGMLRREGLNREPLKKYKDYKNLLVPDRERFDHFLSGMFHMLGARPYKAAAVLELTPAWLRFLQSQGLIDEDLRKRTLRDLEPLADDLLKIYRRSHDDPALRDAMESWKWNAGKEPM